MAQVFDRSSNALARVSLVLTGLIVIALGVALNSVAALAVGDAAGPAAGPADPVQPQAPRRGPGPAVPVLPHVGGEVRYAGIPPTKTCINCHSQIWTNAQLLEPVRQSWATGASIQWIRVHDLPDYVYFNHEIHVNKGIGCASCHGRVDEMPLMYQQNTLQMEWCLNCHRNPAENLRPTSEIYNMAWAGPSSDKPVWCAATRARADRRRRTSAARRRTRAAWQSGAGDAADWSRRSGGPGAPQSGYRSMQPHPVDGAARARR